MKKVMLLMLLCLVVTACAKKGDKGDTGDDGMKSTKTYTGTPTSNPYTVTIDDLNTTTQVINVYSVYLGTLSPLPHKNNYWEDYFTLNEYDNKIDIYTINEDGSLPSTALYHSGSGQSTYRIEVKTFNSAPAKSAYLQKYQLATSPANAILFGREVY